LNIKTYKPGYFDKFLDYLEASGYGLADGLEPYLQALNDEGWTDRNGKNHSYEPASVRIMIHSAKRLGDLVFEQYPDRFTPVMELAWEKIKKRVNGPQSEKSIDEDKFLPWDEVQKLIAECKNPKIRLIIAFLSQSACRINEALSIKVDDMTRNGTHYKLKVHGKGNKFRKVKVEIPLIDEILSVFGSTRWLFEHDGRQYSNNSITTRIATAGRYVLNKRVSAHMLRHSWCTEQLRLGRSLDEVSKYLGHASISVTADVYSHVSLSSDKAMLPVFFVASDEDEQATGKALNEAMKDLEI
jgi:integrase